ncbi:hypothetical protein Tco_1453106 [Tanacetum coccineum]
MLHGLNKLMERNECEGMYLLWVSLIGDVRILMMDEAHASRSPVLWAEIGEGSLIRPELVQETTNKFEVGDKVLLKVSPWKGVMRFEKKSKLAPKCLADANLHVPLDEIEVDKTLHFVKKPVEIMDREVKTLKRSKIPIVKVRCNSKRGPEFTREREDHMKARYPQLFVANSGKSSG